MSRANCEQMHKLIDLKNFAIYFDTNTTLVGELKKSDMQVSNTAVSFCASAIKDLV